MNNTPTRRAFMMTVAAGSAALAATRVGAQAKVVDEKDPQAAALGYLADSTKVDTKKFPKHTAADKCASCQLYQGKAGDATGGCPLYAGKVVPANAWCSAWVKKSA